MKFLRGTGVALITPFNKQLKIDYDALGRVIKHVERGNVDYLVALGTTGEISTLSRKEKQSILKFINASSDKPLIVGHGGNNTQQLIDELDLLQNRRVKALLSVTPYYNRPSQQGLIEHYQMLADNSPVPLILYNVPARTAVNLEVSTTLHLSNHGNIIGIKEASGSLEKAKKIISHSAEGFYVLSGEDSMTLDMIKLGADGVISVIANYKPKQFCEMVGAALQNQISKAVIGNAKLKQDYQLLMAEGNPTSVKTALQAIQLIDRNVRLPLIPGSEKLLQKFKKKGNLI
jgi:4-hydroxy-tetrahydrodipicolinate synthase